MATITIKDLHQNDALDREAMAGMRGAAGAPWVFGWIRAFVDRPASFGTIVNLYQTNNIFVADQMNNQFQVIDVDNAAPNAQITVNAQQRAGNVQLG